jgi:hypothetical protein
VVFVAAELARIGGETVEVRYMPHDLRRIEVFTRARLPADARGALQRLPAAKPAASATDIAWSSPLTLDGRSTDKHLTVNIREALSPIIVHAR